MSPTMGGFGMGMVLLSRLGPGDPHQLYVIANGITAIGFLVMAVVVAVAGWRGWQARLFALAALVQALWAGALLVTGPGGAVASVLYTLHLAAWSVFLASMLPGRLSGLPLTGSLGSVVLVGLKAVLVYAGSGVGSAELAAALRTELTLDLLATILALLLAVGVFHAAGESKRWALKFICFPLAMVFAFDLVLLSQSLAMGLPGVEYVNLSALLNAVAVPLVAWGVHRCGFWAEEIVVSRQAALYSITLIGVGAYLLAVSVVALLLERGVGTMVVPLRDGLLVASILLVAFLLSSGSTRARIKGFVGRHLYVQRYDYALEWRKFMHTLSEEDPDSPLETRIIRACADLMEVPGGALWLTEAGRLHLAATWNYRAAGVQPGRVAEALFQDRTGDWTCLYGRRLAASPFGADPSAWAAIPLPWGGSLIGVIVLSPPRAPHTIDAQDEDLLMLIARQCSSFVKEHRAVRSLEETRQFAKFNRQYAFVAHDIKNIVSQLSVMVRNFERHYDNPAFRDDIQTTINNAVDRLQEMLKRLARFEAGEAALEPQEDLRAYDMVREQVAERAASAPCPVRLAADAAAKDARIRTSRERFTVVLGHLLSNACEANGSSGSVQVSMAMSDREIVLDISDEGPGMSFEFVRDYLFQPFRTTKASGYGVGAYQCREFAREQGGDLDVISSPGSGTTMRLRLPVAGTVAAEPAAS